MISRTFSAGVIACAWAICAHIAQAQITSTFGIGAGPAFPLHNIVESNYGYNVLAYIGIEPPGPIGVRVDGGYNHFIGPVKDNVWSGTASALFKIPVKAAVKPYVLFGLGYYKDDEGARGGRVGFDEGVGARVSIAKFAVFGEIRAHNTFVAANYIPITFGVQFPL
jgi:hypothetical protein